MAHDPSTLLHALISMVGDIEPRPVDASTDLIASGFDSLASLELCTRIEDELMVPCTLDDVFEARTLTDLAAVLAARSQGTALLP